MDGDKKRDGKSTPKATPNPAPKTGDRERANAWGRFTTLGEIVEFNRDQLKKRNK